MRTFAVLPRLFAGAVLTLSAALAPVVSAQVIPTKPHPEFPPLEMISPPLHLGYHRPGALAQGVITFLNTGEETLKIKEVKSSCDCTMAEPAKKVINAGDTVDLFVGMNVSDTLGKVKREVVVYVEGYDAPIPVIVNIEIGYPVRFNKGGMHVGAPGVRGAFTLDSVEGKPFRVLAVNGSEPQFIGFDPNTDEARAEYELFYDWSSLDRDARPRWLVVETDHAGAEMIEMPTFIEGVKQLQDPESSWRTIQRRVVLGRIDAGRPVEAIVSLGAAPVQAGKTMRIRSSHPGLSARIVTVRPSATQAGALDAVLQLIPSSATTGFVHSVVEFETEGHTCGVDVFARVEDPAQRGG